VGVVEPVADEDDGGLPGQIFQATEKARSVIGIGGVRLTRQD
jgi:hypothetical protein